jgi:hypothetical protein
LRVLLVAAAVLAGIASRTLALTAQSCLLEVHYLQHIDRW